MIQIITILVFSFSLGLAQEPYSRIKFGEGWNIYKDCITVREHVLISLSKDMVIMDSKNCDIEAGKWYSIWENRYFTDPKDIDIDHTVPLKWAYNHGAILWSYKERNDFANNYMDEYHLVPISIYNNRSKGSKGPDRWLPPYNRCLYINTFIRIVNKYKLIFTEIEKTKIDVIKKEECRELK